MAQKIWVAYATAEQQFVIALDYVEGMTVQSAIDASGLKQQLTLPSPLVAGIFGVKVSLAQSLSAGDRVEIYRPLTINPKDIRRRRAASNPVGRYNKGNRFKQSQS